MSNTSDFVDLLNKEIEELQKAIKEPIKCNETATEISREYARRVMLENQLFYKKGCLSKNYYYEYQISVLEKALELAVETMRYELGREAIKNLYKDAMNNLKDNLNMKVDKGMCEWYIEQAQKEIKNASICD